MQAVGAPGSFVRFLTVFDDVFLHSLKESEVVPIVDAIYLFGWRKAYVFLGYTKNPATDSR